MNRTISLACTAGSLIFINLALDVTDFAPFYGLIAIGFAGAAIMAFVDYRRGYYLRSEK